MQDELKVIQKRVGTTFIHVTHDQEEAMAIADRIVVMNRGRIEDSGSPSEVYMRPRSHFSASFMGEANFVHATVADVAADEVTVETALGRMRLPKQSFPDGAAASGGDVTLCIRPEHFRDDAAQGRSIHIGEARVSDVAFFGTHHGCSCVIEGGPDTVFKAHLPQTSDPRPGSTISLDVNADHIVILAAEPKGD
ncbi:ABC transporter ATP-binding protein [Methyloligella sp. 2.7D]